MKRLGSWDWRITLWLVGNKVYANCPCGQCSPAWTEVDPGAAYLSLGRKFAWLVGL